MRVAVFRAAEDGRRTAARLDAMGHTAVPLPVLHVVPTGASVPTGGADAVVFTSAHAPEALARHAGEIAQLRALPCWCVGDRTASAARTAGFTVIETAGRDAAGLARAILAQGDAGHLLFITGRDRKPNLEHILAQAGTRLTVVEAYAAEPVPAWSPADVTALATASGALHYSRRSASLASRLADASGCGAAFRALSHHCLSRDVAGGLDGVDPARIATAARPDEDSLLATLARLAKAAGSR